MKTLLPRRGAAATLLLALAAPSFADLRLPSVLSDGMVLPRERLVSLWGWTDPEMPVTLLTGWDGQMLTVLSDRQGAWRADIRTGGAGGPYTISFITPTGSAELRDVLLGEVWLCSGQSNMEWPLSAIVPAYRRSDAFDEGVAGLDAPTIRLFHVPRRVSLTPESACDARWEPCTPATADDFSAVAYFFARALQDELQVPIGLIGSYWGGTPVEAWTSGPSIRRFDRHRVALEALERARSSEAEAALSEAATRWWDATLAATEGSAGWAATDLDDSAWTEVTVPGNWEQGPLGALDGIVWHRRAVDVPDALEGRALTLSLGPVDDDELTLWNGTRVGATGGWTTPRRYVVPGELVRAGRNVLTVVVHDSGGGGGFHGDAAQLTVAPAEGDGPVLPLAGTWRARPAAATGDAYPRSPGLGANTPSALFNGMIAPVQPYPLSGVIWYQGESNRYAPLLYRETFAGLIADWRRGFGDADLPFLWAQIAPFRYGEGPEGAHRTALLREAQDRALALPHTGQAVLTDVGNPRDIHPLDKWTVGRRLALLARAQVYGAKLDPSGPRYESHSVEGAAIRVRFSNAGDGLVVRGADGAAAPTWFYVAGEDRRFHPAVARVEGAAVVVSSPDVPAPVAVRFAWGDAPEPNLFDGDGLPAAPFRTDDWDDVVIDS